LLYFSIKSEGVSGAWGFASACQCVLWIGGTGVGTFNKPYVELGNAYVALWLALGSSVRLVGLCYLTKRLESTESKDTGIPDAEIDAVTGPMGNTARFAAANKVLLALFVSSAVVLIESARACDKGDCTARETWAIICSALSVTINMILLLCNKLKVFGDHESVVTSIFCIFLAVLWSIGVYTMTFEGPFKSGHEQTRQGAADMVIGKLPGNGYFGAWASFLLAYFLFFNYGPHFATQMKAMEGNGWQYALIAAASIALATQSTIDCFDKGESCGTDTNYAYAAVTGWVGLLGSTLVMALGEKISKDEYFLALRILTVCQLVWWSFATGFLTFEKPYTAPGNGYFACLVAVTMSAGVTAKNFCVYTEQDDDGGAQGVSSHTEGKNAGDKNEPYGK